MNETDDQTLRVSNHPPPLPEVADWQEDDARSVARLHALTIRDGFLPQLGIRFLASLYRSIAVDHAARVWTARRASEVIGFCAYTSSVSGLYRRILRKRWLPILTASLPYALIPRNIMQMLDTVRYPSKASSPDLPDAEVLSIGVHPSAQGTGAGRRLIARVLQQAARDGVPEIKVLAGASLEGANRFYQRCGFEKRAEIIQHDNTLNVYVANCLPSDDDDF